MFEGHFCALESQSNIYGLTKVEFPNRPAEVLAATLRGEKGPEVRKLKISNTIQISKEMRFAYIPGDAEIISIDAFNKYLHENDIVIGITFIKNPKCYLNIYSEVIRPEKVDLNSIAQVYCNIELQFIPYQLTHTQYIEDGNVENVFLLSGSDNAIHVFREDKHLNKVNQVQFLEDTNSTTKFPEFRNLPNSSVVWMDVIYFCDYQRRVSAFGFVNGWVRLTEVNTKNKTILNVWNIQHDSPITSLNIFTRKTDVECPHFVTEVMDSLDDTMDFCYPDLHLLVNSAIQLSVVYRSFLENGFLDPLPLPQSDKYDSVLCACIADVNMDGENEIILGTYGQELLVYSFIPDENSSDSTEDIEFTAAHTNGDTDLENSADVNDPIDALKEGQCPFIHNPDASSCNTDKLTSIESQAMPDVTEKLGENIDKQAISNEDNLDIGISELKIDAETSVSSLDVPVDICQSENLFSNLDGFVRQEPTTFNNGRFEVLWKRSFAEPIFAIDSVDLIGDGLEELVVLTLKGLHVLQHEADKATALCLERLREAIRHSPLQ